MASSIPEYRLALWDSRLKELFDDAEREQVLSWLHEVGNRSRVIVVGAGFTKNAHSSTGEDIPDWDELTRRMARHLRVQERINGQEQRHDPLELADLFVTEHSRESLESWMGGQLDDEALTTGAAHRALWESEPHAVITTNFLDTTLEKPTSSVGVPIYRCAQLAQPLGSHERHIIYFHGHRAAPDTWVTSRRDYEDLPRQRPAVEVKVRQLLAEFPAVVVGYSMRDPDFHQIYRDTARVLEDRHPSGLVVLPFAEPDERLGRLRTRYWETLRVRFVHFRPELTRDVSTINKAYESFFRLVELPRSYSALKPALRSAANEQETAIALELNLRRAEGVLADIDRLPFLRRENDKLWDDVLSQSLSEDARKRASEYRALSWNQRINRRRIKDGDRVLSGPGDNKVPEEPEQQPLVLSDWVGPQDDRSAKTLSLFALIRPGEDSVRRVEQALRCGARRDHLCRWLSRHLDDDYLAPSRGAMMARRMLALLALDSQSILQRCHREAREVDSELATILEPFLEETTSSESDEPPSDLAAQLIEARNTGSTGNRIEARDRYMRVVENLGRDALRREELSLQAYFGVLGALWNHSWDEKRPESFQRQQRALEQTLPVREWRTRVSKAKEDVFTARAGRNGFRRQIEGYEPRGWGFSAAPAELWREFEYARQEGAPLGLLTELLRPLVGTFSSSKTELELRLQYDLDKPGDWLSEEINDRRFSIVPKTTFEISPPPTREEVVKNINDALFSPPEPQSGTVGNARLSVLSGCPEVLTSATLSHAFRQLEMIPNDSNESALATAWIGIAGCCSWQDIQPHLLRYVQGCPEHHFRWRNLVTKTASFPWRDWIVTDSFWEAGGEAFVAALLEDRGEMFDFYGGWLLHRLRYLEPDNDWLRQRAIDWVAQKDIFKDGHRFEAALQILQQFDQCPESLQEQWEHTEKLMSAGELHLDQLETLANSERDTRLRQLARTKIIEQLRRQEYGEVDGGSIAHGEPVTEIGAFSILAEHHGLGDLEQERVLKILSITWSPMPFLSRLLRVELWSGERWRKFLGLVLRGDNGRNHNEWRLRRLGLVMMLNSAPPKERDLLFSEEFASMRRDVANAIFDGDARIAKDAMRALPNLFLRTTDATERSNLLAAIHAAASDQRISLAEEAAYVVAFLLEHEALDEKEREELADVQATLSKDSTAVVLRQLQVGKAVGIRHARI